MPTDSDLTCVKKSDDFAYPYIASLPDIGSFLEISFGLDKEDQIICVTTPGKERAILVELVLRSH